MVGGKQWLLERQADRKGEWMESDHNRMHKISFIFYLHMNE